MIIHKKNIRGLICCIFLVSSFLITGCYSTDEREDHLEENKGQFTLFMSAVDKPVHDITFNLSAINIISDDGSSRVITDIPVEINSNNLKGQQVILGERRLPEGKYKALHLVVSHVLIRHRDRLVNMALPPEGLEIPLNVFVRRQQNISIFVNWNVNASIVDGYLFDPVFTVKSQVPELSTLLIYVTNEDSNNVSVINKQSGEVVATIMVGSKPRGIAAVVGRERSRVYVANSGSNTVSVIDPTTNKVENEVSIKFGRKPEGIAVATVSQEKDLIFVTNYASNSVSVIDSITFQEIEKIDVGKGPVAIAVDPSVDTLLGTHYLNFEDMNILRSYRERFFNVYVVNKNSNDMSIIRMDKISNASEEVLSLKVGWNPVALSVDYGRGKVYVVNYGSDKLSVLDIVKTVKGVTTGAVSTINDVGEYLTGIVTDPVFDRFYLLKESPGEIVIIKPIKGSLEFDETISPVMGVIPVGELPKTMILGPDLRRLYVINRGTNTISVVNKTTKKEEQIIAVGNKPYGIALFQN